MRKCSPLSPSNLLLPVMGNIFPKPPIIAGNQHNSKWHLAHVCDKFLEKIIPNTIHTEPSFCSTASKRFSIRLLWNSSLINADMNRNIKKYVMLDDTHGEFRLNTQGKTIIIRFTFHCLHVTLSQHCLTLLNLQMHRIKSRLHTVQWNIK